MIGMILSMPFTPLLDFPAFLLVFRLIQALLMQESKESQASSWLRILCPVDVQIRRKIPFSALFFLLSPSDYKLL